MQQHVLDDRIGAPAVLYNLVEVAADGADQFVHLAVGGLVAERRP